MALILDAARQPGSEMVASYARSAELGAARPSLCSFKPIYDTPGTFELMRKASVWQPGAGLQ